MNTSSANQIQHRLQVAIAWCLTYSPKVDREIQLLALREYFNNGSSCEEDLQKIMEAVKKLMSGDLSHPQTITDLQSLIQEHPLLWSNRIGLVYGGATKIKQYVFESPKLQEIRGASALLDNINLVDLPAFFHGDEDPASDYFSECQGAKDYCQNIRSAWLESDLQFKGLAEALIPELIIYSTGGNILAFCPEAVTNQLANAIEKRYTSETLTANSCAVGETFKPLEIRLGLLPDEIKTETFWLPSYQKAYQNSGTQSFMAGYIPCSEPINEENLLKAFQQRKSFNELTGKLAVLFNKRRSGNITGDRPSRQFPVIFETHPYLRRDAGDQRSAIAQVKVLPGEPWYSESIARKRLVGQIAKRDDTSRDWYRRLALLWQPNQEIETWVSKYEQFLEQHNHSEQYFGEVEVVGEARSLIEIGNASRGFVAYIYADGNNMGGHIQKIKTPQEYQKFSQDIFNATEKSVYKALFKHLKPHKLQGLADPESECRNEKWIHPFEIIAIGGDDVMLIVPADKALAIAETLGIEFEAYLANDKDYKILNTEEYQDKIHRYRPITALPSASKLSMSTGVLITADATPIYYAEDLTTQLLKTAKEKAKHLKNHGYYGGTVDFMVLKTVTMISSNIQEFRKEGLVKKNGGQELKFYAAPYTLHELKGLLDVICDIKEAGFPKSQLYQIRSLLERGKRTAILNYRYFRVRLDEKSQSALQEKFENGWCKAKTNDGSIAPWMHYAKINDADSSEESGYETIWRDLVDLYDFSPVSSKSQVETAV
jgi:CRISPR-associated protein Cmr2